MVLNSTAEIVEILGGLRAVSDLTGSKYTAVWHWRKTGRFPARTYTLLTETLSRLGHVAPRRLWGMTEEAAA